MSYNKILDKDIKDIKNALNSIIEKTKSQFAQTYEALENKDIDMLNKIIEKDVVINEAQDKFIRKALWKISKQQMVATDLRLAIGGILIVRDLERSADIAKNLAKFIIKGSNNLTNIEYFSKIFNIINSMFNTITTLVQTFEPINDNDLLNQETIFTSQFVELYKKLNDNSSKSKLEFEANNILYMMGELKELQKIIDYLISIQETINFIVDGKFNEALDNKHNKENIKCKSE